LIDVSKTAVADGIPVVVFNSGCDDWQRAGALMYIGQDEVIAGTAAGKRLKDEDATKVHCVIDEQGVAALDKRCNGVETEFGGVGHDVADLLACQTRAFVDQVAVIGELGPLPGFDAGLHGLRVVAAITESAQSGGAAVKVD
jgi:ABC-type sugar transport system substrate-binding protein